MRKTRYIFYFIDFLRLTILFLNRNLILQTYLKYDAF